MLLVGHGTRDERGANEFQELLSLVRQRLPTVDVQPAFIEICQPDIVGGLQQLIARGVAVVTVTPLLLFAAGHAKQDIPQAIERAKPVAGGVVLKQAGHLGCHPRVLELSQRRFRTAVERNPTDGETTAVLVGRGSSDPLAASEMQAFVAQRRSLLPAIPLQPAFVAKASPSLDDLIDELLGGEHSRIVIQPHLLFRGAILDGIRDRVAAANGQQQRQNWSVTEHLGPDSLLAEAVVDRFLQAQ